MGKFVDKLGSKKIILSGLLIYALCVFAMIFASSAWVFLPDPDIPGNRHRVPLCADRIGNQCAFNA